MVEQAPSLRQLVVGHVRREARKHIIHLGHDGGRLHGLSLFEEDRDPLQTPAQVLGGRVRHDHPAALAYIGAEVIDAASTNASAMGAKTRSASSTYCEDNFVPAIARRQATKV